MRRTSSVRPVSTIPTLPVLAGLLVWCVSSLHAENIVFPPGSGVIDVTQAPYYADNTGQTDVTDALTRALVDNGASGSWTSKVVYLPNGTYLVRNSVRQKEPPGTVGPHLQGQSREGTVIRLADGTWPTVSGLRYVLSTGNGVAQCFNRGVRNITVNIGSNNAGASGIWWFGNNQALLSDVNVISEDGQGLIGLDAGTGESGPSMVRNLYVKGFNIGVTSSALNAVTFANIKVEGQNTYGILARGQNLPAWFDGVESINRVTAFRSEGAARAVLVDANLTGGADTCEAVWNYSGARLFARNVRASGYRGVMYTPSTIQTLDKIPTGMYISEFSSHKDTSLFASSDLSLNLPKKLPPEPEWEQDMSRWAVISQYTSGRSHAQALQAAIDDASKTSIIIDMTLDLNETVYVRGNIKLIFGTNAYILNSGGTLEVTDGSSPVVKFQGICHPQDGSAGVPIIQRSSRACIIESMTLPVIGDGTGDLFVTDLVAEMEVRNAQQNVWVWHLNSESWTDAPGITVSAGAVRCFGWKTERGGRNKVSTTGGALEMLGFLIYAPCGDKPYPAFNISNTEFTLAMMSQFTFCDGALYEHVIQETQGGTTRSIYASDNPLGYDLPLYVSHTREPQVMAESPLVRKYPALRPESTRRMVVGGPAGTTSGRTLTKVGVYDLRGRDVMASDRRMTRSSGSAIPEGVYFVRRRNQ